MICSTILGILRAGNSNYSNDFLLCGKGKKLVTKELPRMIISFPSQRSSREKKCRIFSGFPVLRYLIVRYLSRDSKQDRCHEEQLSLERFLCRPRNQTKMIIISAVMPNGRLRR